MRLLALTILLAGCGGDSDGGADADTDDTDAGTNPADPCSGVPTFDPEGMSCAQLANAYEEVIDASDVCTVPGDCTAIDAPCENWPEVGCWYIANDCADSQIGPLAAAASGCSQPNAVCECGSAPAIDCVGGRCQFTYSYR